MTEDNITVSHHRERARQERHRAEIATDDFARRAHLMLARQHDDAADNGGYRLHPDVDR